MQAPGSSVSLQRQQSTVGSVMAPPSVEVINATLSSMPPNQLMEVLVQMKNLIHVNPDQARQILFSNPQLSYALFQSLIMMGLVDATLLQKLTQNFTPAPVPVAAMPMLSQQQQQQPPSNRIPMGKSFEHLTFMFK